MEKNKQNKVKWSFFLCTQTSRFCCTTRENGRSALSHPQAARTQEMHVTTLHLWIQWENSSFTYIHLGGWKIWWKWKWTSIAFLFFYSYWPLKVKDIHAALHTMILTTSHPRPIQNHMRAFGLREKAWDNHAGNLQPESWLGDQNLGLCCCKETVPTTAPQCTINWTGPNENVWWACLISDSDLELV